MPVHGEQAGEFSQSITGEARRPDTFLGLVLP